MTTPAQIDRRMYQVAAKDPRAAMAAIRTTAQALHPDAQLVLEVVGDPADGLYAVLADYWAQLPEVPEAVGGAT